MKQALLLYTSAMVMIFVSCRTSQKFHTDTGEDKALFKAINDLNRKPNNTKAQADVQAFYPRSKQYHEENIAVYQNSHDINKYSKILTHINALQHIYNSIMATPGTAHLLRPKNYIKEMEALKEEAAAAHYDQAKDFMEKDGRQNSLQAYWSFKKANEFISGYKNVSSMIQETYEKSIIHVVINPIEDRNIFFASWGGLGGDLRYRPEEYQRILVNELSSFKNGDYPARFYTDREAKRNRIDADLEINIQWINLDPIQSVPHTYHRQVSKQIQIGSDTSGKPVYKNVQATLQIIERNVQVRGDLEYRVQDQVEGKTLDYGRLTEDVSWKESYATYSGDSRALGSEDWALINNQSGSNRNVDKGEILNILMRKIYPDLRRRIQYSLN